MGKKRVCCIIASVPWTRSVSALTALGVVELIWWREGTRDKRKACAIQRVIDKKLREIKEEERCRDYDEFIDEMESADYDLTGERWDRTKGESRDEN